MRFVHYPTASAALLLVLLGVSSVHAEDIDLFLTENTSPATRPNVLIVIDTAASNNGNIPNHCSDTNKKVEMAKCAIVELLKSSDIDENVNVGLALFSGSNPRGGYIKYAVRQMTPENKLDLIDVVEAVGTTNNAPYALSMHEAYLYYAGDTPRAGLVSGHDTAVYDSGSGKYISPAIDSCQNNYIIFIGAGSPDTSENNPAKAELTALGGDTSIIPLTPSNSQSNYLDEYARFLFRTNFSDLAGEQNLITYTIGLFAGDENSTPARGAKALLSSAATQGGGKYFEAQDSGAFARAMNDILKEVQAVNSVFAAVTLPVSVNVRGTFLNQVYMGVFRPDESKSPRWLGNLKKYQLAVDTSTNTTFLADFHGNDITNQATGFVNPGVDSFWTADSSFWSFSPSGIGEASDSPDGDIVEKGGAGQWLRANFAGSQADRKLYTCTGCSSGDLLSATPFDTTNSAINTTNTGTTDGTDLQNLIEWVRGRDLFDENANASDTDARASIHGDVLHSRPAVINYNRHDDDNDVFVFYGANDGIFHAIQGGQIQPDGTPAERRGGTEQWGFISSEFFGSLKTLRDASPDIIDGGKPYFADGPIGVYRLDANTDGSLTTGDSSGDVVNLYLGMRRGGRFLYALDVIDPAAPRFLWKRTNTDLGFSELGQTWSLPRAVKLAAFANPVIVMGGGYDAPAEDEDPQAAATMGRAIMILDATNGNMLWQAGPHVAGTTASTQLVPGMTFSLPADVLAIDRNANGVIDRLYAVDTGANIWRVDVNDADPENWKVTKIAELRGAGGAENARKFLNSPDVVFVSAEDGGGQAFDALLLGSGDRENPFDTTIVNRFYLIKDPNTGNSVPDGFAAITEAETDLYDATENLIQVGNDTQKAAAAEALKTSKGWYVTLEPGEKVVGNAVTLGGTVFFGTNQPTDVTEPGVCTNLGIARLYSLDYLTGAATIENDGIAGLSTADRATTIPGGGFPPSPVPAVVIIDGKPQQVVLSGTQVQTPPSASLGQRFRTYWHNSRDGQ